MARSLSNVRMFSAYLENYEIVRVISRRGYAAAAAEAKVVKTRPVKEEEEMTWMPDPKTGFFRPGSRRDEIDAAELRAMMLKKKDSCAAASR